MELVVAFLLLIQMGYIIAKAIENPLSCNDSPENDPRLKRSDEKEIHFDSEDTTGKDPNDDATTKTVSKPNSENDNDHDTTDNDRENSYEFASNSNALAQKLSLANSVTNSPVNVDERGIITDGLTDIKDAPLEQPVYYKAIDPKYIIISGLSLPKPTKNITNVSKSEDPVNVDLKETITTQLDYSNLTKAMNVSNGDDANNTETKKVEKNYADTDVSNIRELREHLLDHLLDYFLNIIKEENYIRNDTRKKNGKDTMKVEEKLRNYYDPHHLDMPFDNDDNDYYDTNLDPSDYQGDNDSDEDLLDNFNQNKAVNKENITNIYPLTLTNEVDLNATRADISEDLQKEAMSLEQNLNKSSPDGKYLNVNEPVTSKYVNLIEKKNDLTNALLNTTEKSADAYNTNVNVITTTERSISNEALNDKAAEVYTDILNYSEEAVTDGIVYDNGALTVNEYTSYEDYIDLNELEVVKNLTVHANDSNPIVVTTENGRRKNGLENKKYIVNGTSNDTYNNTNNSQIGNDANTSKDERKKDTHTGKKNKPDNFAIQDLPNKNINENTQSNEDNLAENNKNISAKISKPGIKRKLRIDKNCGKLVNKNNKLIHKKSNKHNCRKSITLNLNINLI